MHNILVLGGSGYIGSRLVLELSDIYPVIAIDLINGIDYNTLSRDYLTSFDVIILLAGHSSVSMCREDGLSSFNNNVTNFIWLFEKLRGTKVKFIYASSASVYHGINNAVEDQKTFTPLNFYDLTKHWIDQYALLNNGVEFYGLRFGTVCGYSPVFRTDLMINSMFVSYLDDGFIKTSSSWIRRPVLAMSDLVRAVKCIIASKDNKSGIYNLCSFNNTVEEISNIFTSITMCPIIKEDALSKPYDFSMNTRKFEEAYQFNFYGTVESIVKELFVAKGKMQRVNRKDKVKYELQAA